MSGWAPVTGEVRPEDVSKYSRVTEQNGLRLIPAVFSHTGQIRGEFKRFVEDQIKQKMIAFENEAMKVYIEVVDKFYLYSDF